MPISSLCAFYDDSVETHANVKNVKTDYGALADGVADDSAVFQSAIDWISANGGGDLVVPYDADGYRLKSILLKSNVHLLIDADTIIYLAGDLGGNVFRAGETGAPAENVSIRGVGGRFKVDLPSVDGGNGTRAVSFSNVFNFKIENIDVLSAKKNYSGLVFGVSGFDRTLDRYPTQGTIRNASIFNAHFGYGLIQVQAADTVLFENLYAEGGVALRLETGWNRMNIEQFGGAHNIVGRNIRAKDGHGAVLMGAHSMHNGLVQIDGVYAENCTFAAGGGAGSVNDDVAAGNPDATPGTWAAGSYIRDITAVFGLTAQLKTKNLKHVPTELESYIQLGADSHDYETGSSEISFGPMIYPVSNKAKDIIEMSDVKAIGFDYRLPIITDLDTYYGISEDPFNFSGYATTLHGDLWSVAEQLNAGGINWLSGNGTHGVLDTAVATGSLHGLDVNSGLVIEAGSYLTIRSDFRYHHAAGGPILTNRDVSAFGLVISDTKDHATGVNVFRTIANRGNGIGALFPLEGYVPHLKLGVDIDAGDLSDWFRLEWVIERGASNYQGTLYLYDDEGVPMMIGSPEDLGIPNGTKIYTGYTTGTNSLGAASISSFSRMSEVHFDNYYVELQGGAPPLVEFPAAVDPTLHTLESTADTYALQRKPVRNHGTEAVLTCKYDTGDRHTQHAYLRFDLSAVLQTPIQQATLRLKVAEGDNTSGNVHTVHFVSDDSWSETELAWGNKPAVGAALDDGVVPAIGAWIEFDVTDQVSAEAVGDDLLSVVLTSNGANSMKYHSKEAVAAGDRPELVIEAGGSTAAATPWDGFVGAYLLRGSTTADEDKDGLSDFGEYVFGGHPLDAAKVGTRIAFDSATGDFSFSIIGDDSLTARVLTSPDLDPDSWTVQETFTISATNGVLNAFDHTVDTSSDKLFIRLEVERSDL